MPDLNAMKAQMAQRMSARPGGGAGLPSGGSASSPAEQYPAPSAGTEPTPGFANMLQQITQILVQGNPADLKVFGAWFGQIAQMVKEHQMKSQAVAAGGYQPPTQPQV